MPTLDELVSAGRYKDALCQLRANAKGHEHITPEQRVLRAELAQYTGLDEEALGHARRVLDDRSVPPSLAARCHIAMGEVHRNAGDPEGALAEYRQAVDDAERGKDDSVRALAELRILLALADGPGPDAAAAYVSTVRRHVSRAGSAALSCALHLYLGEVEALRGLLDNAREHVRIGRSLARSLGNHYLDGVAAVDASCAAFLLSDLDTAEDEALRAMRESVVSGHAALRRAAITNLAHLELVRGRFARSAQLFTRAARLSPPDGMVQAGVADGLAQLALARGDLAGAERILSCARPWAPDDPKGSWSYGLWTTVTRAKLMLRSGEPGRAAAVLRDALAGARDLADPLLASSIGLLLVEACAGDGRAAEASRVLAEADTSRWAATIETLAEFGRVIALLLCAAGDTAGARAWFDRSGQALSSIGHHAALAGLASSQAGPLARRLGIPPGPAVPPGPIDQLPPRPARIVCRTDACSPIGPVRCDSSSAVERAAAIVDSGAFPAVVGDELMHLLEQTGCVSSAVLSVARGEAPARAIKWFGCSWTRAEALMADPPRLVDLGEWQDRRYAIAVAAPADASRLLTLLSLERLAAASRFVRQARNDERERVALWPIDAGAPPDDFIFCSSEMTALVASARRAAGTAITVLLTGETGTGKEMIARIIHRASPRAARPFVAFNCTAVPRELAESQLFGHRKGAFTGAVADHPGVVRAAAGGTLYLDEIGDLGLDVQPKLLRFLESGEVHALGDPAPQKADARVIASTNRHLEQLVAEGLFRADLYYRLNVVPFRLPPLRERREEVPPLSEHFLARAAREFGKRDLRLSEETIEYLVLYRWPGNVRQLANEMRRLAAMSESGAVLMPEHLDPAITAGRRTVPVGRVATLPTEIVMRLDQPHAALVDHAERAQIRYALEQSAGNLEAAARLLGLSRKGLYLKRRRLGMA